jgi:hypothetical protein
LRAIRVTERAIFEICAQEIFAIEMIMLSAA